jgi:hypothetical protein
VWPVVDSELRKFHGPSPVNGPSPVVTVAGGTVFCSLETAPLNRFGASSSLSPRIARMSQAFSPANQLSAGPNEIAHQLSPPSTLYV